MHRLAQYIKEREGFESVITDEGFATYRINGEEAYIRDIWVERDYRQKGVATDLADRIAHIARRANCKFLTGTVLITVGNPKSSIQTLLAYGMDVIGASDNIIFFKKEL